MAVTKKKASTQRRAASRTPVKRTKRRKSKGLTVRNETSLWILVAVSILLFASNFGFGGKIGNGASHILFGLFGLLAYVFPVILLVGSFFLISNKKNHFAVLKFFAGSLLFCAISMFLQLLILNEAASPSGMIGGAYAYSSAHKLGGGALGGFFAWLSVPNFGLIGAYAIDIAAIMISFVMLTGRSALLGMKHGGKRVYESAREDAARIHENYQRRQEEQRIRRMDRKAEGVALDTSVGPVKKPSKDEVSEIKPRTSKERKARKKEEAKMAPILPDAALTQPEFMGQGGMLEVNPENARMPEELPLPEIYIEPVEADRQQVNRMETEDIFPKKEMPEYEDDAMLRQILSDVGEMAEPFPKEPVMAVEEEQKPAQKKTSKAGPLDAEEDDAIAGQMDASAAQRLPKPYVFPPVNLLKKGSAKPMGDSRAHLMATANKLQQTLKNFGVNVTISNVSSGPSVTRYEIQPEMGVKVSKIVNLTDDIKLNLAAADIRMEAPIPGKAAIGIEIPNKENVTVMFRDLIESKEFQENGSNLAFAAGKDIGGQVVVTDIAKMPHVLIAGATGSGKSVCINTIIMSILYKANPDDVKLIMVDPKVVELSVYNGIPHLMIPVVTDPKKAAAALNWAVAEMDDRYKKFAEYGVRDLKGYNAKIESIASIEDEGKPQRLPQIVIIVDELADLMMVASHEVETAICRLAQLARAAGLHLIIATQRPSVNVITGLIKANMPSRIAFAVTSGVDSRTILDMVGAEKLLGKGDMLFFPQNYQKPLRVQGAFVSDNEVSDVVEFLKRENGAVEYNPNVQEKMEQAESLSVSISDASAAEDDKDVLFREVGRFLIESEKASIGAIQRKFKVGFNRAARIMDQLGEAGLVGPEEGTKPRKILMSLEEFEQFVNGT